MGGRAVKRIFVKVFGFSDGERHALNTAFRLSETPERCYAFWHAEAPMKAGALLLDGDNWEASLELANPANDSLRLLWVGDKAPAKTWKAFARPLRWPSVIAALDAQYAPEALAPPPAAAGLELDIDFDLLGSDAEADTRPATLEGMAALDLDLDLGAFDAGQADTDPAPLAAPRTPGQPAPAPVAAAPEGPRVLVVDADRDARLYLRAKLASAGLPLVDDAANAAEALRQLRFHHYSLVLLDLELPDSSGWQLFQQVRTAQPRIAHVILTGQGLSPIDALRGWFGKADGALAKPLDPVRLHRLLRRVALT